MMLWEIEVIVNPDQVDREAGRVLKEAQGLGCDTIHTVRSSKLFLIQGELSEKDLHSITRLVTDHVVEHSQTRRLNGESTPDHSSQDDQFRQVNVLYKPGMTDNVAYSTKRELEQRGLVVSEVATCRRYWLNSDADPVHVQRVISKVLANEAIERVVQGSLQLSSLSVGQNKPFERKIVNLSGLKEDAAR